MRNFPGGLLLAALFSLPAAAQTTLHLTAVPAGTPAGQPLYVAGSFNGWQPAAPGYAFARQPDGSYQLVLPASVSGPQVLERPKSAYRGRQDDGGGRFEGYGFCAGRRPSGP